MTQNLLLTLQIGLVGMGLVFGAILLLWALMALLVRITDGGWQAKEREAAEADARKQAAATAVAVALAQEADQSQPHEFPLPPTAIVSAWQAVMRTKMLNKRGQVR